MARNEERFEDYLREFAPRAPRALPAAGGKTAREWRRLAAAAVLLIAVGTSVWLAVQQRPTAERNLAATQARVAETKPAPARLTLWRMNEMALAEPVRFDAHLVEESRELLPDFRSASSTLRALAKE
jgi:hypothetical protein